jgi:hypothetical protein
MCAIVLNELRYQQVLMVRETVLLGQLTLIHLVQSLV